MTKRKRSILIATVVFAALFFVSVPKAFAYSSYFTNNCQGCHNNVTSTCNGCHSHGTHPDSSKSSLNVAATTSNSADYAPGESVTFTITGGYRTGWVRVILYNGDPASGGVEVARSTGPNGEGGGASFPITLTTPAPATPGTYTYYASWYGNQYDKSGAYFGSRWRPDPNNANHGEEIVAATSFTVADTPPPGAPAISVTDSVSPSKDLLVSFGSVYAGSSATQTVTVTNTGTADLVMSAVGSDNPLTAPFTKKTDTCSNQSIAPAASCTITLSFDPTTSGAFTDSFNISSNDPANNSVTVNVSGTGTAAPTSSITVTDSVAPTTDLIVPFGSVNAGSSATQTVTVTNTGTADLIVGTVGTANPLVAPFTNKIDTCSNQSIAPAASCMITISFDPTTSGAFTDSFNIPSNDPTDGTVTITVSGSGASVPVPDITITDSVAPTNDLMVDFGTMLASTSKEQTVTVTNDGNADLILGTIGANDALATPFSVSVDECSGQILVPAASCIIRVTFSPESVGSFSDSFNVPSNDPDEASVVMSVSGQGQALPVPDITITDSTAPATDLQIPFGTVVTGGQSTQTVTVKNDGNADLVIGAIGSTDSIADPFSIRTDACSNQTLAPTASCIITVAFTPTTQGAFSDSFNISSNDPDEASATVSISGSGSSNSVGNIGVTDSIAPEDDLSVPFGDVRKGKSVDGIVSVENLADGQLIIGTVGSTNALADPFSITSDECSGKTLSFGQTCLITVHFTAPSSCTQSSDTMNGVTQSDSNNKGVRCTFSGSLAIPSNDPDAPDVIIQVSGASILSSGNVPPNKPKPKYPANGQTDLDTSIDMRWDAATDADGDVISYELRFSEDPTFGTTSMIATVGPIHQGKTAGMMYAGTGLGFVFFGFAFIGTTRGRKGLLLLAAVLIMASTTFVACSSGSQATLTPSTGNTEVTRGVSGLQSSTTYYWKIIANDGNGGVTESDVSSFTTK